MKKLLVVLAIPLFTLAAAAQDSTEVVFSDVRELLQASVDLSGGSTWDSISTLIVNSSMSVTSQQGLMEGSMTMKQRYPGFLHAAVTLATPMGLLEQTQLITPEVRYTDNNFMGRQELPYNPFTLIDSPNLLKNLLMHDHFDLSMKDSVFQDNPVYAVTAKVDDQHLEVFVQKESLRPIKRVTQTAFGPVSVVYSDFREIPVGDGSVIIPHVQEQTVAGTTQIIMITDITVNADIDPSIFVDAQE